MGKQYLIVYVETLTCTLVMTDSTKQSSLNASQTTVNSEMTASFAKKWAVEMDTVEENFRKLLNRATVLGEPLSGEKRDLYHRHKCQLVNSMLFYTTRIISDGMKFVMEGNAPSVLSEVLQKVHLLQQEYHDWELSLRTSRGPANNSICRISAGPTLSFFF